jgi:hypothetical protein
MTEQSKERLKEQIKQQPDCDVAWLWLLCQRELEQRDRDWPVMRGYRAGKVPDDVANRILNGANATNPTTR